MTSSDRQPFQLYYEKLVRFVANTMVDPHRYFEQKLVGELLAAADIAAENEQLELLLGWIDDGLVSNSQRAQLRQQLAADDLPSMDLARSQPALLRLLLNGARTAASAARLRAALATGNFDADDRRLLQQALAACRQEP